MIDSPSPRAYLVIRYGEIALKKGNRAYFEKQLKQNIKSALKNFPNHIIINIRGRIVVSDIDEPRKAAHLLSKIFGIISIRIAYRTDPSWSSMESLVNQMSWSHPDKSTNCTVAIRALRSDKSFNSTSTEIGRRLGASVLQANPKWTVKLKNPDIEIVTEVHKSDAFISYENINGPGGLPVGTGGKLGLLLSGGLDSPVAGYQMARRGATLYPIYFHSFPYTNDHALEKVKRLAEIFKVNQPSVKLTIFSLTKTQEAIRDYCNKKYSVLLTRRMMFRLADYLAQKNKLLGLITGESLGQVASQTLENMRVISNLSSVPIYRPLISFDKTIIVDIAKQIGSYDISIEPHRDCCDLFVDPHPVTKASAAHIESEELKIPINELFDEALKSLKVISI